MDPTSVFTGAKLKTSSLGSMTEKELQTKINELIKWINQNPGKKLPYDASNIMAEVLEIEDWGTWEEVEKMATMGRNAKTREEAYVILMEIRNKGTLENSKYANLKPSLSGKSIREIKSGRALISSFDTEAHWMAAANIDQLFRNGIKPWEFDLNPNKENKGLKARSYLFAPMKYGEKIVLVKLTIKEFKDPNKGTRLYSCEVIDRDLRVKKQGAGQRKEVGTSSVQALPARHPDI
jgi:nucleoid DNA-binding protein